MVLFGQPELHRLLDQPSVRQLKQRIVFSYNLLPLDRDGMEGYVMHRLTIAGYNGKRLLTGDALQDLYRASGGIPRLVNIICHKALIAAYGQGKRRVERRHMRMAVQDTLGVAPLAAASHRWAYSLLGIGGLLALAIGGYYYYGVGALG